VFEILHNEPEEIIAIQIYAFIVLLFRHPGALAFECKFPTFCLQVLLSDASESKKATFIPAP
jgi:hypothetical protein